MIEIEHLTKRFKNFVALHDVSLSVGRGRVTGIVGPNGSGKSTLIKSILGLVRPNSGTVAINGYVLDGSGQYRSDIGYMPQIAQFPQDLKGREVLDMIKRLRPHQPSREQQLLDLFGLNHELGKRVRTLSGGNRQKLSATIACMYNPRLLILDEPTAGLDPLTSTRLKNYVQSLKEEGGTVVLTTHIMSDLDELADDLILLIEGKVRYIGGIRDLKLQTGELRLEAAVARILERAAA